MVVVSCSLGRFLDIEYWWLWLMCVVLVSFSMAIFGDGMLGLLNFRLMMFTFVRRVSIFRLLMIVKTYGGRLVICRNSIGG